MLVHPETIDGRRIWLDPEVEDLVHRLHFGDATLGWEGDERLALYMSADKRWELWRLENDGEYRMVMRSKPNTKLDSRIIMHLVAHDVQRGYNVHNAIKSHNEGLETNRDKAAQEATAEAIRKVYHAANKDIGHNY